MDLEIWASIKHGSMNSFLPLLAMINMKKANFLLTNWLFWLNLSSNFFLFKVQSKGGSHKRRRSENTLHWKWQTVWKVVRYKQTVWKVVISMDDIKPLYKFVSYIGPMHFHLPLNVKMTNITVFTIIIRSWLSFNEKH